jgi:hypothetical protein
VLWSGPSEPPDAVAGPLEARRPCPTCGATWRIIEVSASGVGASAAIAGGGSVVVSTQRRLLTHGYGIRWTEPTGPKGSWLLEVFDSEGNLVDGGMGDDPVDAILGVAERLLPPER